MKINLISKEVLNVLLLIIFALNIGNIISIILIFSYKLNRFKTIIGLLNLNREDSFGTLFSFLLLFVSCILLGYITYSKKSKKKKFKYWQFLTIIFLFLSLDEILSFHEILGGMIQNYFQLNGVLFYSWVIPYGFFFIVFSLSFIKFLGSLPRRIKSLFIFSGLIYVFGAIGFEMMGGFVADTLNRKVEFSFTYQLLYSIEETLEMLGITFFIYGLLEFICINEFDPIKISFNNENTIIEKNKVGG